MFKLTILATRPGQWQLLRDVPGTMLNTLEGQGWDVKETWSGTPSIRSVLAAVHHAA